MIRPSEILLDPQSPKDPPSILQLYQYLELFREHNPPRNTLFVLGRPSLEEAVQAEQADDQLLVIDPPEDVTERFRLEGNVAALNTGTQQTSDLPRLQTQSGGVAHIRIGDHYLDIYTQTHHAVIYLPALGVLYGGSFGSPNVVPDIGPDSDGAEELELLRLLAGLAKQSGAQHPEGSRPQLFIPHVGEVSQDRVETMERLAADVAYIHGLRRTLPGLAKQRHSEQITAKFAESLLPAPRRNSASAEVHAQNVRRLLAVYAA